MSSIELQTGPVIELSLKGDVTIAIAPELKDKLATALNSGLDISLSLTAVDSLHITALQLLWAALKELRKSGRRFVFAAPVPQKILLDLEEAGFSRAFLEGAS